MAKKPYSEYTNAELMQAFAGKDPYAEPAAPPPSGIIRRAVGDTSVALAKGASGLLESAKGVANIVTGGAAQRVADIGADLTGINFKDVNGFIDSYYSPEARENLKAVQDAKGFRGTIREAISRPSTLPLYLSESLPYMAVPVGAAGRVAKAAINRGASAKRAAALAGTTASVGEGVLTAGSVYEDVVEKGGTYGEAAGAGLGAGAATALLGQAAGKLTGGPLEAILARRAVSRGADVAAMPTASRKAGAALGAVVEGTEEAAQGVSEQGFTNIATGEAFFNDAGDAAAMGVITGAPLGAGLGAMSPQQLSTDGLSKKPIDPLGDKRAQFVTQLNALKQQYADGVASGAPADLLYSEYLAAAQQLKANLLAPAAVDNTVLEPELPAAQPTEELLNTEEAAEFFDTPAADLLDALGDTATGSELAQALAEADPESLEQMRNIISMAVAERSDDPQYKEMLTEAMDNPAAADPAVFVAALAAMRESRDEFDSKVEQDLRTYNPELMAELDREANPAAEVAPPKVPKRQKLKERLDPVARAAATAAEGLNIEELAGLPKSARASTGKAFAESAARALLGDKPRVVRGAEGKVSKQGTIRVAQIAKASNKIVETARRIDRLSAKVSPRITESRTDVAGKLASVSGLLDKIRSGKVSEDALLSEYKAVRKSLASTKPGKKGDPEAIKFYADFKRIVNDKLPFGQYTRSSKEVVNALETMESFLKTATAGRNVTGGKAADDGITLPELNDMLYRDIEALVQLMGGAGKSRATAIANIDKIIGAYKTEKFKRNEESAARAAEDADEFGAYETDEDGNAAADVIAERNKFDRMLSMSWNQFKKGRISRIRNIKTGLSDSPISTVPDTPIRQAIEAGTSEDASKSPLAEAYRNGFQYDKDRPQNATPPGTRAVLSYIAQTNTPMARTLANMLKESLANRMPRKGQLQPKNPIHMEFLTPEDAVRLGVTSARWYSKAAYAELRKTNPDMPAGGEMILVNRATPEAILHELLHAATASWVQGNATNETVQKLQKQLDVAMRKFEALTKDGIPNTGPLQDVYQTLESIKRAGAQKGLSANAAQANRVAEFISYSMTRASFQEFLAAINVENIENTDIAYTAQEKSFIETLGNVWDAFIDVMRMLLGVKPATEKGQPARFERNREFMTYLVNRVILVNKLAAEAKDKRGRKSVLEVDTDTSAFKRWFGDSKVVDTDGEPLVVYHGTIGGFNEFSRDRAGQTTGADNAKLGFFFSDSPQLASVYAKMAALPDGSGSNVMPVYLSIKNPLRLTAPSLAEADRMLLDQIKDGNDGAIIDIANKQTVYMVRNANQVKSSIGNNGAFDPESANILNMDTLQTLSHEAYTNMGPSTASAARAALPPRKMNIFDRITSAPFRLFGAGLWAEDGKGIKNLEARAGVEFDKFMKAHPAIASIAGNFVEYVAVSKTAIDKLKTYLKERDSANYLGNMIEDALEGMSREDQMTFMQALTEPAARAKLAPDLRQLVIDTERAITALRDRAAESGGLASELRGADINEMIQFAIDKRDLATKGFSAGTIKLTRERELANTNVKAVLWNISNDPASPFDNRYYPVYAKADPSKIDYFIASNRVAELKAEGADTTVSWGYRGNRGQVATFARNKTFKEIQKEYPNVPLAHFLANTLAEMSKVVAGRQLVDNLVAINKDAADADKIIFADEAALKGAMGDKVKYVAWDDVELSADQKRAARRPDYWVKVRGEKYGKLDGQFINGSLFSALQDMHSDSQFISAPWYNDLLRFWKGTKTKLSPGTHVTNTLSNVTMLYMHDIGLAALRKSASVLAKSAGRRRGKVDTLSAADQNLLTLFNESGAVLGNYSQNELHRKMAEAITKNMLDGNEDPGSLWEMTKGFMGY
jgi:hypothetical protein